MDNTSPINTFQKYLTAWVLLCMVVGLAIGHFLPSVSSALSDMQVENVNIPIAVLVWLMIFPMMLKIDFTSVKQIGRQPKGLFLTWIVNWLIKPFTMFVIAYLFFMVIFSNITPEELGKDYLAGAALLGAAPCTAMVFVWSSLSKGNAEYTLVQVATNDLIILIAFVPIVGLLLGVGGFTIPWGTLFLSIVLFVVVPLVLATVTRIAVIRRKGEDYLNRKVIQRFDPVTMVGLLVMLILLFTMQAELIIDNPFHILLIAIPLVIQTFLIFGIAFVAAKMLKLPFDIAAPASYIGASNFFELAVAVAVALFPLNPGVSLATVVGVLTEVPVMLLLVRIANSRRDWFDDAGTSDTNP